MICPRCDVSMVVGEVIDPKYDANAFYIAPVGNLTNDTLDVIKCWKCPECGHSEEINSLEREYLSMEYNLKMDGTI